MLQGSAILLLAARPVPYKGFDSPAPARLCIDFRISYALTPN